LRNENNKEDENRKENMLNSFTNGASSMSNSKNIALRNLDFFERKDKEFGQMEFILNFPDFDILHKHFEPKVVLYLSPIDLKLDFLIKIYIDKEEKTLFSKGGHLLSYSKTKNMFEKDIIEIPFGLPIFTFAIPLRINLKFGINIDISILLDLKHKEIDEYFSILIQPNIHASLSGTLSTNFPVLNAGVKAQGDIIGARGDLYILVATYEYSYAQLNLSIYSGPAELFAFAQIKYLPKIDFLFIHTKPKKIEKQLKLFELTDKIERIEKKKHIFGNPKPRPIPIAEEGYTTYSHAFYLNNILIIFLFLIF